MKNDTSDFSPAWSFITIPSVGINEYFSNESVALYPNPASGQTTISLFVTRPAVVNYTLTDLTGQEINAGSLNLVSGKNSHTIDLTNFANGIYLFNLTGEGQSFSKKLIIK